MEQLLCHLVGDYVLQNHWMANNKTRAWLPALVHVFFYGLPFLLLDPSAVAMAVIVFSHLVIDRYRLASYWVSFWGTGTEGVVPRLFRRAVTKGQNPTPDAPPFLAVWLLILVDNTLHLTINYGALRWL